MTDCASGATNYRGQIIFAGEGQGDNVPPALWVMNPKDPFNTTGQYTLALWILGANKMILKLSSTTISADNSTP